MKIQQWKNQFLQLLQRLFKGESRSAIVRKNILYSFFIRGISIVISLLLVPMTLGYINAELYGIWLTLSSVMVWLGFFDIGFNLGLRNKLTEAVSLGEWEKGKVLVSTSYFMMLLIFLPLCLILELIVPWVNWSDFLNVDAVYNEEITLTTHFLVGFFCLQMIFNLLSSVISAFQKVALSSSIVVLGNFFSLLVIWALTQWFPPSLVALVFALSAMPVLVFVVASIILYKGPFKQISPSFRCVQKAYIREIFSLGIQFFLIQIQVLVLYQSTNFLISNVSGPLDVTNYNIANRYLGISMMAFTIILAPVWSAFTDAFVKKDYCWMKRTYKKIRKIYLLSCLLLILFVVISPLVYQLWLGDSVSIPMLMTIAVCIYMMALNWNGLHTPMINGIGTIKLQTIVTLIGSVIHIPLSLLLGKYFGLGAYGIILSMILVYALLGSIFAIQLNKILNQRAKGIWMK